MVSPRGQDLPDPRWGLLGGAAFDYMASGELLLPGSCGSLSSWNPICGHLASQGGVWGQDSLGALDTESSAAPPRNPAVPLQRVDSDTEKKTLVPGPSAAVRVASLVPLPGWGIPGEAGKLGVGTQAPSSWEGGSSPQINCTKCDTGVIHVGRKALRWGHRVCVCVWGCDSHQEVREGLMKG